MTRRLLALLVLAACAFVGGCFNVDFDPGVRVRTPRAKIKAF